MYFSPCRYWRYGSFDIYCSRLLNGKYTSPEAINTPGIEHDPCVSGDEQLVVYSLLDRADGFGSADMYYGKGADGQWTPLKNAGSRINTPAMNIAPT